MKENTTITPDYYSIDPNRADEINEKYDCYVIPLADAFRPSFIPLLRRYTRLIKRLKIPVIVIGVGLRAPFEPKLDEGFPFDDDVKDFVKAVLEKSSIIGLRGEITSDYLTRLGFREGVDHTVIGCPSMYTFGQHLKIRNTNITKDSTVCVNSSMLKPISGCNLNEMVERWEKHYPLAAEKEANTKERQLNKHKIEIAKKNKRIKHLEGTINRKFVREALKTANMFRFKWRYS